MSRPRFLTLEEIVREVEDSAEDESENEDDSDSENENEIESGVSESDLSEYDSSEPDDNTVGNPGVDPLYVAKDGILWSHKPYTNGRLGQENVINLRPGVTRVASSRVTTIRDSFLLYFPPSITKIVIESSNKYGKHLHEENHIEIDEDLFHAYLAILLLAGVYKSKNETLHDLFDDAYGRPIFRAVMSEKTFLYIHKIIRFDDVLSRRMQRSDDKFAPIRNFWEKWVQLLPTFYNQHESVTVDEQLLGFHGRCKFRQYIPSKPERYGIKFWLIVVSYTCYVWKIQPYLGKGLSGVPERNQGERVVLDFVDGLRGHNVTMDNLFSSHSLGQKLLQKNMTMVGTLRKNKRSIPPKLLTCKNIPRYESTFAFTSDTALVSYISHKNKCTVLTSTMHNKPIIANDSKKLPEIVSYYNSTKGSVDTVDKMLSCYSSLNAYFIFNEIDPNWKLTKRHTKRKCFLHELAISLSSPYIEKRKQPPRNHSLVALFSRHLTGNVANADSNSGPSNESIANKSQKTKGDIFILLYM